MQKNRLRVFCLITAFFITPLNAFSQESGDDIIVEKNLFSADRKKWIMEDPKETKGEKPAIKKEINDIALFGTVITGGERFAVLRTKKSGEKKEKNDPYMTGDYISGFLVKEIETKKVVLKDESDSKEYVIYMNDEKKDRAVEKTDIKAEESSDKSVKTEISEGPAEKKEKKTKAAPAPVPQKGQDSETLKKRFVKDIEVLKKNKSDLVRKQADRDYQKLEALLPAMSPEDQQEVIRLKAELEKIK